MLLGLECDAAELAEPGVCVVCRDAAHGVGAAAVVALRNNGILVVPACALTLVLGYAADVVAVRTAPYGHRVADGQVSVVLASLARTDGSVAAIL